MPTITSGGASNQWDDQQGDPEPEPQAAAVAPVEAVQGDGSAEPVEQQPETQDAPTQETDAPVDQDAQAPVVETPPATVTSEPPPPPPNPEGA